MKRSTFPSQNAFGTLPIDPIELASRLNETWRGETPGTTELFERLTQIASRDQGQVESKVPANAGIHDFDEIRSFFKGSRNECPEFRLDFLLWKQGFGALMACESEMSARKIEHLNHDFEKLLCWKAPLKLMIVREQPKLSAQEIASGLANYANETVKQFVKDECFLLFIFGKDQNHAYTHIASGNADRSFEFREHPLIESREAA